MPLRNLEQFDIKEGRVTFERKIDWFDNQSRQLIKLAKNGNFILLIKDENNILKFSYFDIETGKANLEIDIGDLSPEKSYTLILSWSAPDKMIKLYIDGILKGSKEIVPIG